jgi:hypothetical protein
MKNKHIWRILIGVGIIAMIMQSCVVAQPGYAYGPPPPRHYHHHPHYYYY